MGRWSGLTPQTTSRSVRYSTMYADDVYLREKLTVREDWTLQLPAAHTSLGGKTPYEHLREKLAS